MCLQTLLIALVYEFHKNRKLSNCTVYFSRWIQTVHCLSGHIRTVQCNFPGVSKLYTAFLEISELYSALSQTYQNWIVHFPIYYKNCTVNFSRYFKTVQNTFPKVWNLYNALFQNMPKLYCAFSWYNNNNTVHFLRCIKTVHCTFWTYQNCTVNTIPDYQKCTLYSSRQIKNGQSSCLDILKMNTYICSKVSKLTVQ